MKYLPCLLLGAVLLGNGSCKEDPGPSEIFGDWQWVSHTGGFTGKQVYTPASTNSSRTLSFGRDSMFVECINGQCTRPTKFTSRMERSFFDGEQHLILTIRLKIYLAPPDTTHTLLHRYSIREVSRTLRIAQEWPDGFVEIYQRK